MNPNTMAPSIAAHGDSALEVAPRLEVPGSEGSSAPTSAVTETKTTAGQLILVVLGAVAFLYFARPVVLPVFLACVAGMTLKPLIRWLSYCHIPPAVSAAVVLSLLVAGVIIGFVQLGQPALTWINEAPQHMTELRQRDSAKHFQLPVLGVALEHCPGCRRE